MMPSSTLPRPEDEAVEAHQAPAEVSYVYSQPGQTTGTSNASYEVPIDQLPEAEIAVNILGGEYYRKTCMTVSQTSLELDREFNDIVAHCSINTEVKL